MAEGIVREDGIVDIVNIDVSTAKFGITTDTPGHVEQPVITIRVKLEGCTLNGDPRPWVDLRTTVTCWKMMNEAFALAIQTRDGAIDAPHKILSIKEIKARRRFLKGLPPKPTEDQIHEAPK